MADQQGKDKRFEVALTLEVKEIKDGEPTGFFDNTLRYHDIGYDGVVAVEQVLMEALGELTDAGILQAMQLGLGEKLQALGVAGVGDKVAAMAAKVS
jgi:hypothetical protein